MAADLGTIRGSVSLDIRKAVAGYAALRAQNAKTVYTLRGTGDSFVQAGKTMGVAGGVMVYAFAKVVQAAGDFERKMDFFSAVTDTSANKMQTLSKFTLQLAQDSIYSAGEIADGFVELGKAGVTAEQIIGGIGKAMANLGAAGDIPLAESGQIITSTIQQFDLKARDAIKVTDLLAGAANASIADITDIGVSLKYVGGVANAAGLGFEDTATAISLLAKAGIRGSTAGTSLRQMIVSLGGVTDPAATALEGLGIITEDGSNKFFDAQGNVKSLAEVFQILHKATADLTAQEKIAAFRTIFNNRALSAASILSRDGAEGFRQMNAEMRKTTAADVARERLDNLSGDIEILRGNIETLMVQAGTPFQDEMRKWVQGLTKLIQKFGELDPSVQTGIVRFIGIAGAALLAMGTFSIIVGTVFRFIAAMIRMKAAIVFVSDVLDTLLWIIRVSAYELGTSLVGAIAAGGVALAGVIAIVLAVAAVWIIAYKKIKPFHDLVNNLAAAWKRGFDKLLKIAETALKDPTKAWEMYKRAVKDNLDAVVGFAEGLKSKLSSKFKSAAGAAGDFVTGVVHWFTSLPGRVLSAVTNFIQKLTQLFTLRNIGYAIGFVVGTVVRKFVEMGVKVIAAVLKLHDKVISFFSGLPGKVGHALGFIIGRSVRIMLDLRQAMIKKAAETVVKVIDWFQKLPGRIANFLSNMVTRAINLFTTIRDKGPKYAADMVTGIIKWVQELPGRVASFITNMVSRARTGLQNFVTNAIQFGGRVYDGIIDGIRDLPGAVSGIVTDIIDAIKGQITAAFNAVKDFAKGLWDGFKEGLNAHSPTNIERLMWQVTGTMDKEVKKLRRQTLDVQRHAKKLAMTQFSIGQTTPRTADKYAALARDHAANQNRSRTLLAASQTRRARVNAGPSRGATTRERVDFVITNWRHGRGYFEDIAQDVVDNNETYNDTLEGMG